MTIKFHGKPPFTPTSDGTLRALAAIIEKEVDYDFIIVDMKSSALKQEPFISLNPFAELPALEDGEVNVFESRAITKYLAYNYDGKGTPLICKDQKQMADLAVWMEVEAHKLDPIGSKLVQELVYKSMFGMDPDNDVVEELEPKLAKVLDIYEARLSKTKYLAGESFTLADLHHLPVLHHLMNTKVKNLIEEHPYVSAWCKDILARPSWKKILAIYKQN